MGYSQKRSSSRGRHSRRVDEVTKVFEHHYRDYQYRFVEFFIEHVSDVGRPFNGDLQAVLVLAVLGQSWLKAARSATADGILPEALPAERLSISASRIADITGIPRQTVRRKLEALEKRGWILRDADGSCRLASANGETVVKRDLSDIDRRALLRVAHLFADLETFVTGSTNSP